jgi:hypothetical protein
MLCARNEGLAAISMADFIAERTLQKERVQGQGSRQDKKRTKEKDREIIPNPFFFPVPCSPAPFP